MATGGTTDQYELNFAHIRLDNVSLGLVLGGRPTAASGQATGKRRHNPFRFRMYYDGQQASSFWLVCTGNGPALSSTRLQQMRIAALRNDEGELLIRAANGQTIRMRAKALSFWRALDQNQFFMQLRRA